MGKNGKFKINRLGQKKNIFTHLYNLKVVENNKEIEIACSCSNKHQYANVGAIPLENSVFKNAHLEKKSLLVKKELSRAVNNFAFEDSSIQNLEDITEKVFNTKIYIVEGKHVQLSEESMKQMQLKIFATDVMEQLFG